MERAPKITKFPTAEALLVLHDLEMKLDSLAISSAQESRTSSWAWKVREAGRSWGFRASATAVEEAINNLMKRSG